MSKQHFPSAADLDTPEAGRNFMAAAGLSGPIKQHNTIKPCGKAADTQAGFERFLAAQKTNIQDKTGIGWGATTDPQSEVHTDDGWGPDSAGAKTPHLSTQQTSKPPAASMVPPLHQSFVVQVDKPKPAQPGTPRVEQGGIAPESKPLPSPNKAPNVEQRRSPGRSRPQRSQGKVSGIQQGRAIPEGSKPKTSQRVGSTYQMERVQAPQIEILAPNLNALRVPRPNKKYEGSDIGLLSSVSWNPTRSNKGADNGLAGSKDIRNDIGLPNHFHRTNDGTKWEYMNLHSSNGWDADDALWEDEYINPFIEAWMSTIPNVQATFLESGTPDHWNCDINPATGKLIEPIKFPETLVSNEVLEPEYEFRRVNWTSSLMIRRQVQHLIRDKSENMRARSVAHPIVVEEAELVQTQTLEPTANRRPEHVPVPADDGKTYGRWVPRMPCFLRPAERVDMEAVAKIYETEMKTGLQVLDSEPLDSDDWEKILANAKEQGMPFIVAVRGNVRKLGIELNTKKGGGNIILSQCGSVSEDKKDPRGSRAGEVLGFGFLSIWQPGLAGSTWGASRGAARMHCYVHPDYRRKSIGHAIMSMILDCSSSRFHSENMFDFVDPEDNPVYWSPERRADAGKGRIIMCIFVGYLVKHTLVAFKNPKLELAQKDYEKDVEWARYLFEEILACPEKCRFDNVYRTAKHREGSQHWLDEILFEHQCQWDVRFHEAADKY